MAEVVLTAGEMSAVERLLQGKEKRAGVRPGSWYRATSGELDIITARVLTLLGTFEPGVLKALGLAGGPREESEPPMT